MISVNEKFGELPGEALIQKTVKALKGKGVKVWIAETAEDAKKFFYSIIPEQSEIMNMVSTTLQQIGIDKEIMESGKFKSVKKMLEQMGQKGPNIGKKRMGTAQEWVVGSVHAVTQTGSLIIASATGSQIPSYAYGADKVLFLVGAQKIVTDLDEGIKRIYEYCLPLENERSFRVYGTGSGVNKILIINQEVIPNRLNIVIIKQKLGF